MVKMSVTATVPGNKEKGTESKSATIDLNAPENLEQALSMYGEDVVFNTILTQLKIRVQSAMRTGIANGETPEAMQERLGNYRLGTAVSKAKTDPKAAYIAQFQSATPEERKQMLKELKAMAG